MLYFRRRCGNRQSSGYNPGSFLKGLRSSFHDLNRADCCPAKGQPLQESFGVFFCLDAAQSCRTASALNSATGKRAGGNRTTASVRVTRWDVARVPTVGIRVEIGKCASKIARIPARLSAYVPRPYWIGCMKELGIKSSSVLNRLDMPLKTYR